MDPSIRLGRAVTIGDHPDEVLGKPVASMGVPDAHPATPRGIIERPWQSPWPPPLDPWSACCACRLAWSGPATTAWSRAWRVASGATWASTPPPSASRWSCSPSPTASGRSSTWRAGRSFRTTTPVRRRRSAAPPSNEPSASACSPSVRCSCSAGPGSCSPQGWCGPWSSRPSASAWCGRTPMRATAAAASCGTPAAAGSSSWWAWASCSRPAASCRRSVVSASRCSPPVRVSLLLGPWILRLWRDLGEERRQRIRSEERSEIAAHLHDSVLQTLALIQRAEAPGRAARSPAVRSGSCAPGCSTSGRPTAMMRARTLSAALERVVTDVEDRHDIEVDLVLVGDCPIDPRRGRPRRRGPGGSPNAARHADVPEVSLYVEVEPHRVSGFVRDRGNGCALDAVKPGPRRRAGVDHRPHGEAGGRAEVHTGPGEGTEVDARGAAADDPPRCSSSTTTSVPRRCAGGAG